MLPSPPQPLHSPLSLVLCIHSHLLRHSGQNHWPVLTLRYLPSASRYSGMRAIPWNYSHPHHDACFLPLGDREGWLKLRGRPGPYHGPAALGHASCIHHLAIQHLLLQLSTFLGPLEQGSPCPLRAGVCSRRHTNLPLWASAYSAPPPERWSFPFFQ